MDDRSTTGRRRSLTLAAIAVLGLLGAACGSTSSDVTTDRADEITTPSVETTTPETTGPETTVPETTVPPTTASPETAPAETTPPATTEPPTPTVPAGWAPGEFPETVFPPCCASNWYGVLSPELSAESSMPIPDGIYHLRVTDGWTPDRPDELPVEIARFEWCGALPEGSCEVYESYAPDELGIDPSVTIPLLVRLDDTVRVGVIGWGESGATFHFGNGSDLVALATAFAAAVDSVVAPRLAAGETTFDIVQDLAMEPAGGFGPVTGERANLFEIVFDAGAGPDLLLQTVASWESMGGDGPQEPIGVFQELNPTVYQVIGGVATLYFYAGYYS